MGTRAGCYRVTDTSCEDKSGWTLKAISQEQHDTARHEWQETVSQQGRLESHCGRRQCCSSTARRAGTALVFVGVDELGVRCCLERCRGVFVVSFLRVVMVDISTIILVLMNNQSAHHLLRLTSLPGSMVIWATERHGCSRSTLHGNCQHQQPHQQRSEEHTHIATLPQQRCRAFDKENTCARTGGRTRERSDVPSTKMRRQDDRSVIYGMRSVLVEGCPSGAAPPGLCMQAGRAGA